MSEGEAKEYAKYVETLPQKWRIGIHDMKYFGEEKAWFCEPNTTVRIIFGDTDYVVLEKDKT